MTAIVTTITPTGGSATTIHSWVGYITGHQKVPDVYHRLGGTDSGVQSLGSRSKPTQAAIVVVCADYVTAQNTAVALDAMRAGFAVVVDGFGISQNVLVHDVDVRVHAGAHGYAGVLYPYRVEGTITVELVT